MKKIFLFLLIICLTQMCQAQQFGVALDLGYSFKFLNKPLSQFHIGGITSYSKGNRGYSSYDPQIFVGGGAIYGKYNDEKKWIPAVTVGYGEDLIKLYKTTVTPYNVVPSFQMNFFNYIQAGIGYSIGYRKIKGFNLSGIYFSVNVAVGVPSYYIDMGN